MVACAGCGDPYANGVALAAATEIGGQPYLLQICDQCIGELEATRQEAAQLAANMESPASSGVAPVTRRDNYYGPNWADVRAQILDRDGNKCQGQQHDDRMNMGDHVLVVHHIAPLRTFRGDYNAANVPGNLITLCTICHGMAHRELNRQAKAAQQ